MENKLQLMNDDRLDKLEYLINELIAAYPATTVTPATIVLMTNDLAELNLDDLEVSLKLLRRESRFFPSIADIFERTATVSVERIKAKESRERAQPAEEGELIPMPDEVKGVWRKVFGGKKVEGIDFAIRKPNE